MYELKISVHKVMGECTAEPPMKRGDYFTVRDGDIRIPEGGYICLWALQSILPLITPKEREIAEEKDQDWLWRVNHAQCPDPAGRVIFKIERLGTVERGIREHRSGTASGNQAAGNQGIRESGERESESNGELPDLRVVVEEVRGKCTSGLRPGDFFVLRSGRLYIPVEGHFCLYALHAALPLLPAKQRAWQDEDWLKEDNHVICPDPAGNVIMRLEKSSTLTGAPFPVEL